MIASNIAPLSGPGSISTAPATLSGWRLMYSDAYIPPQLWPIRTTGRPGETWSTSASRSASICAEVEDAAVVAPRQAAAALVPEDDEVVVGQRVAVVSLREAQ